MQGNATQVKNLRGLSIQQIPALRQEFGSNVFKAEHPHHVLHTLRSIVMEPMFILLAIACSLYFVLGSIEEGLMLLVAMLLVGTISVYQDVRSNRALKILNQLAAPGVKVLRDGIETILPAIELVPGDIMLLEEGMKIPADAILLQQNDLSINESILSGESVPVEKRLGNGNDQLYQGTTINTGKCIAYVSAIGNNTALGKLGKALTTYQLPKTALQVQVNRFVRYLAYFGLGGLFIIFFLNYSKSGDWATSLLFALTLAMSAVPEEIPVAFSSFMALGAYKMSKLGIISRQPQIVENLGAVSVICLDKTGTITENKMRVKTIYDYKTGALIEVGKDVSVNHKDVLFYAVLASEQDPFDTMEIAIWEAYYSYYTGGTELHQLRMVQEYPLHGHPPMMTHVYKKNSGKIIAAKGAVERIVKVAKLNDIERNKVTKQARALASNGYRVIAVASASASADEVLPREQDDFIWQFEGLLALYDPPKENIADVLRQFYDAKIEVKLLTGDYPETAINIASQVGILNPLKYLTGEEVMAMSESELKAIVRSVTVFARMFPDAKVKVIEALKSNGEIVAMTGDGVNDGPALKNASIGIAMGKKGTEIARQASDLILTDDNLERMVTAIREGRKIFTNLKKAIRYIISIHIPIVVVASLPVILGWTYPNIFTPIHVIFMELIMGPTCSIFFEREPVEVDNMKQGPRKAEAGLFTSEELMISITQGVVIAGGVLSLYYFFMTAGSTIELTRTIVFTTMILANIFLTFADRSFTKNMYYTIRYKNNLAPFILVTSIAFLAALHFIPVIRNLFQLSVLSTGQFFLCLAVAIGSVFWFEVYKTDLVKMTER